MFYFITRTISYYSNKDYKSQLINRLNQKALCLLSTAKPQSEECSFFIIPLWIR